MAVSIFSFVKKLATAYLLAIYIITAMNVNMYKLLIKKSGTESLKTIRNSTEMQSEK